MEPDCGLHLELGVIHLVVASTKMRNQNPVAESGCNSQITQSGFVLKFCETKTFILIFPAWSDL